MINNINRIIEDYNLEKEAIEIRRHIHSNPELSENEYNTMKFICEKLRDWDIDFQFGIAETGIVALIKGKKPGKTVAIRADMDALPITEETNLGFCSKNSGIMHACGHDAHVAILLTLAHLFSIIKSEICGNVKFLFQPAEETIGGAARMIEYGCLENPHVDYILGLHVEPSLNTGTIGIRFGKMYAGSDMIDIGIRGKSAHGAHPNEGLDTIVIGATLINAMQTVISRNVSPLNSAVCTIGKIKGGSVRNQIADELIMEGIIRTLDPQTRIFVKEQMKTICESIGTAMGAEINFKIMESYAPLINNKEVTDIVYATCEKVLGKEKIVIEEEPDLSCEDFSYFAEKRPSCYFHLGCYDNSLGERVDLHNAHFNIDERCLKIGIQLQAENTLSLLTKENDND